MLPFTSKAIPIEDSLIFIYLRMKVPYNYCNCCLPSGALMFSFLFFFNQLTAVVPRMRAFTVVSCCCFMMGAVGGKQQELFCIPYSVVCTDSCCSISDWLW